MSESNVKSTLEKMFKEHEQHCSSSISSLALFKHLKQREKRRRQHMALFWGFIMLSAVVLLVSNVSLVDSIFSILTNMSLMMLIAVGLVASMFIAAVAD
ncbi:hypothetical protein PN836_010475 [Ningiella sp. W23]|uniref:hypothetical protein n=1 Tax=Ningiella sp. W23 TaxID=3023715 RepID=UPI0037581650